MKPNANDIPGTEGVRDRYDSYRLPEGTLFHAPAADPDHGYVAFIVRGRWWLVLQILPHGRLFGTFTGNGDEAVRRFLFLTGGNQG